MSRRCTPKTAACSLVLFGGTVYLGSQPLPVTHQTSERGPAQSGVSRHARDAGEQRRVLPQSRLAARFISRAAFGRNCDVRSRSALSPLRFSVRKPRSLLRGRRVIGTALIRLEALECGAGGDPVSVVRPNYKIGRRCLLCLVAAAQPG